jgi:hypothetical protein
METCGVFLEVRTEFFTTHVSANLISTDLVVVLSTT